MRQKFALITTLIMAGCHPSGNVTEGSSTAAAKTNQEAPYVWSTKTFPKIMQISSSFNAGQKGAMTDMATSWKTTVGNTNFIAFNADTNNTYNITAPDSVMGIYKATTWPADVSEDALAITQIFGRRYNVGATNEYVSIVHADILMNFAPDKYGDVFQFDYDDASTNKSGFDLRSVILHEMGHFLGLQHIPTWYNRPQDDVARTETEYKASSVMYPSISHSDEKRIPKTKDINALAYKYAIGGAGASSALISDSGLRYEPGADDPGLETKILMELRKTGECVHRENGAVIRRHFIKL